MTNHTKHIKIADYDYDLADERIAKYPIAQRDKSKLLIYKGGKIEENVFSHLPQYLDKHALMVFNNTKVIQARIYFRKATGALIEIFLMEPALPADYEQMFQTSKQCSWYCMVGNLKKWKEGKLYRTMEVNGKPFTLTVDMDRSEKPEAQGGTNHKIDFAWDNPNVSFAEILDIVGELPIPPYLNRETTEKDKTTYQTIYSKVKGSVAAPTAGLHFTDEVFKALDQAGIQREELTLHVGAGTFKPVKSEEIAHHNMHTEYVVVRRKTVEAILNHQCSAIAVGTTSVRTLESLYYMGAKLAKNSNESEANLHVSQWEPYEYPHNEEGLILIDGTPLSVKQSLSNIIAYMDARAMETIHSSTQIIIAPGFTFKIIKMLVTNFHQPQSTLLLLVSAFLKGDWRKVYNYALDHEFRFLSYGDSSLLIP